MRNIIVGLVGAAALAAIVPSAASAADLPMKAAPGQVYSPVSAYNWTGFYAGANLGYGWATASATATFLGASASASQDLNGIVGGGQIGYNYQFPTNLVLGIEADIQGTGQQHTTSISGGGITITEKNTIPYFLTVRGRLGYAVGRFMPYITGGWGYGEFKATLSATGAGSVSSSMSRSLWTVGAGVEGALVDRWTWKIEYLYLDSGTITNNYATGLGTLTVSGRLKDNVVRAGLNYRF